MMQLRKMCILQSRTKVEAAIFLYRRVSRVDLLMYLCLFEQSTLNSIVFLCCEQLITHFPAFCFSCFVP